MGWIRDLMDLVGWTQETRQRHVETRLAEVELASKQQIIQVATLSEVERFDPTIQRLHRSVDRNLLLILITLIGATLPLVFAGRSSAPVSVGNSPPASQLPGRPSPPLSSADSLRVGSSGREFYALEDIYVRRGPGMSYEPLGYVPAGATVLLESPNPQGWSRVIYTTDFISRAGGKPNEGFAYTRSDAFAVPSGARFHSVPSPATRSVAKRTAVHIDPDQYKDYEFAITDSRNCRLNGWVDPVEGGDRDIDVLLLEADDFESFRHRRRYTSIFSARRTSGISLDVRLPQPGNYHLVISNRFSAFTRRVVMLDVGLECTDGKLPE